MSRRARWVALALGALLLVGPPADAASGAAPGVERPRGARVAFRRQLLQGMADPSFTGGAPTADPNFAPDTTFDLGGGKVPGAVPNPPPNEHSGGAPQTVTDPLQGETDKAGPGAVAFPPPADLWSKGGNPDDAQDGDTTELPDIVLPGAVPYPPPSEHSGGAPQTEEDPLLEEEDKVGPGAVSFPPPADLWSKGGNPDDAQDGDTTVLRDFVVPGAVPYPPPSKHSGGAPQTDDGGFMLGGNGAAPGALALPPPKQHYDAPMAFGNLLVTGGEEPDSDEEDAEVPVMLKALLWGFVAMVGLTAYSVRRQVHGSQRLGYSSLLPTEALGEEQLVALSSAYGATEAAPRLVVEVQP